MHTPSTAMAMILALMAAPELSCLISGLVSGMAALPLEILACQAAKFQR
jgi:hypothetical protein